MPKQLNARYLNILKDLRDAEEPYSNRWMTYRRAFESLRAEKQEYADVGDLKTVKYIGDHIVTKLRQALENGGTSQPVSPSKRNRSESSASYAKTSPGKKRIRTSSLHENITSQEDFDDPFSPELGSGMNLAGPSQLSFGTPTLLQAQPTTFSANLSQPESQDFEFVYVDPDSRWVLHSNRAEVDIHANACWYRIRFLKSCMASPLVSLFRLIPKPLEMGNVVEAWIQEQHIFEYNLHEAPGISQPRLEPTTSYAIHSTDGTFQQNAGYTESASLADLLNNEKKTKIKTLDPTRHSGIDREWQVSNSREINISGKSGSNASQPEKPVDIAAGPRFIGKSVPSVPVSLPTPPATQPTVQQPLRPTPSDDSVNRTKGKGKRPVRGRTSEFVPTFSPTDEFDLELEKQSSSQPIRAQNPADASADLIDDIADLTNYQARFAEFEPIVFQPGSFEVTLILDNREVKTQKNRDFIANALRRRNINVEQRSLVLGDVLWIAKCHFPSGAPVNYECVLGYILERKRLDDLCQSIKDGRFHEQKFRLANTGLKVFYLVESHEAEKHQEIFGVQIDTARSSTQVVDGFILKETSGLNASIDYLVTMHKTIFEMYHNKSLCIIPPNLIKRHSYLALQKHLKQTKPHTQYLTSYGCFERLNDKSANLTTRDIFAQMLLCIKGVSAEKAAVIINNFPTMRSLWEALVAAEKTEAEDHLSKKPLKASEMLCRLEGEGRKHFGTALSTNIYNLFRK